MSMIGGAQFARQSDYGQFYLVDRDQQVSFESDVNTPEMEKKRVGATDFGLLVYTNDSLHLHVRIYIHDAAPEASATEMMSYNSWTQVEELTARFPSRSFSIDSPSSAYPTQAGPVFFLPTDDVHIRVSWMEFQGERDESEPVEPNVIQVDIWPIWP